MTLIEQFNAARFPDRWKILGRRLRVFTVAHSKLLDVIGYNSANVSPAGLLLAVRICMTPWNRAHKALTKRRFLLWEFVVLKVFKAKPDVFQRAAAAFQDYLDAANIQPRVWHDKTMTRASTCPASLLIERDLMHYWGFRADDVLRMPLGEADLRRLAILEAEGALDFVTDEDVEMIEEAKRIARDMFEASQAKEAA